MKINYLLLFTLLTAFCNAQSILGRYIITDDGITIEKFDEDNTDENRYNLDNKIYVAGRKFTHSYYQHISEGKKFTYSYYHLTSDGKKYLITKEEQIKSSTGNYYTRGWKFIETENQNEETIKNVILKPLAGNSFKDIWPDYDQTVIAYEYIMNNSQLFSMEETGVIENEMNVWIHPPRSNYFQILELNPFPYIKAPYINGNKWNWELKIGDHWSDERWLKWEGAITNNYEYEIIDSKNIRTRLGNIDCYIVKGIARSRLGETGLISYFNPDYGFVKLEYKNIDGSKTILELEKVE